MKGVGLFDDSSDEDGDEKQDQHMFNLRPEFEGSAGKKVWYRFFAIKSEECTGNYFCNLIHSHYFHILGDIATP